MISGCWYCTDGGGLWAAVYNKVQLEFIYLETRHMIDSASLDPRSFGLCARLSPVYFFMIHDSWHDSLLFVLNEIFIVYVFWLYFHIL